MYPGKPIVYAFIDFCSEELKTLVVPSTMDFTLDCPKMTTLHIPTYPKVYSDLVELNTYVLGNCLDLTHLTYFPFFYPY